MSLSTLSKQTRIRLPIIKSGLLNKKTHKEISVTCHVTRRTIVRDIRKWVHTDDFVEWIRELWLHLYKQVPEDVAFKEATRIFTKTLTAKAEIKKEVFERREFKLDTTTNEDEILSQAARILDRKRKLRKIH